MLYDPKLIVIRNCLYSNPKLIVIVLCFSSLQVGSWEQVSAGIWEPYAVVVPVGKDKKVELQDQTEDC